MCEGENNKIAYNFRRFCDQHTNWPIFYVNELRSRAVWRGQSTTNGEERNGWWKGLKKKKKKTKKEKKKDKGSVLSVRTTTSVAAFKERTELLVGAVGKDQERRLKVNLQHSSATVDGKRPSPWIMDRWNNGLWF